MRSALRLRLGLRLGLGLGLGLNIGVRRSLIKQDHEPDEKRPFLSVGDREWRL